MSEQQEQRDYEALNADTALRLNKAQQRITALEDENKTLREQGESLKPYIKHSLHKETFRRCEFGEWSREFGELKPCICGLDELLTKQEQEL